MGKTVYVLGAGFSSPAKFPLQRDVYPQMVQRAFDSTQTVLGDNYLTFATSQDVVSFLGVAGFVDPKTGSLLSNLSLEDLFTLLDRVIQDRGTFCGYNWATRRPGGAREVRPSLIEVRDSLVRSILAILHGCSDKHADAKHSKIRQFAAFLLLERLRVKQKSDPFSIVSLNWDSLLEDSIYRVLAIAGGIRDGVALADVDYCVYTYPLKGSPHMPSTKQKASGIYNLKILKLHGSATWLRCPNSNVIYTGLGSDESSHSLYVQPRPSPLVQRFADGKARPPDLEPFIITPSFTKSLDLPQTQATWHNAYVELREATNIVFIGYSLPDADHQVRTLLRRAVRPTAKIEVILPPTDDATRKKRRFPVARRFIDIFGPRRVQIRTGGVEAFVDRVASERKHKAVLNELKFRFERLGKKLHRLTSAV
jgi:hypothetical protein